MLLALNVIFWTIVLYPSLLCCHFKYLTVNNLDFTGDLERNLLNIKLDYSIKKDADTILIQIT